MEEKEYKEPVNAEDEIAESGGVSGDSSAKPADNKGARLILGYIIGMLIMAAGALILNYL